MFLFCSNIFRVVINCLLDFVLQFLRKKEIARKMNLTMRSILCALRSPQSAIWPFWETFVYLMRRREYSKANLLFLKLINAKEKSAHNEWKQRKQFFLTKTWRWRLWITWSWAIKLKLMTRGLELQNRSRSWFNLSITLTRLITQHVNSPNSINKSFNLFNLFNCCLDKVL